MGKPVTGACLAAAAAYGSYQAAQSFVPGVAPRVGSQAAQERAAPLREAATAGEAEPVVSLGFAAAAAGAVSLAALSRSSSSRVARRAAAAADVEPPPPPPFAPAAQIGVTPPLGFFDPLNFSKTGDEGGFRKLRISEIKHGRVAMMAAVGAVFQHYVQLPGFEDVPKGFWAFTSGNGTAGFAVLFILSGVLELVLWKDNPSKGVDAIGDYGNPAQLGLGTPLGEGAEMRSRELNNGRAAMFAAVGIIVAELATGKDAMQQFGWS
ncbi:unnamed protein product [Polarella glacialis]|uniref:Uncharacterized protein n=1 Tax=Polarella glacialis TaxID=89957 RepID=A0A813FB37_POLGL|nr:unnamed protein product [Polarella glacialis]CAE8615775.1 unnamed protein product [Polarella glacialis]